MQTLKFLFALITEPVSLSLMLIASGVIMLLIFKRSQRAGKIVTVAGTIILILSSMGFTSGNLLYWLEKSYPVFKPDKANTRGVKWIVVLGGGKNICPDMAMSGMLNQDALQRLAEGIYLSEKIPDAKIILSGGIPINGVSEAKALAMTAVSLGVDRSKIVLEERSRNTYDEAVMIRDIVKKDKFILVTSAYHMKRSVGLFKKQGMSPIPAPAGHLVNRCESSVILGLWVSSENAHNTSRAVHELAGMLYSKIMGQI